MAPVNTRAKKIASFDEKPTKGKRSGAMKQKPLPGGNKRLADQHSADYDPEAEGDVSTDEASDSEQENKDAVATEHYVSVGYDISAQYTFPPYG